MARKPLSMAGRGESVIVREIDCGNCLHKRLCDIGLYPGTRLEVVKNDSSGPMIVSVKGTNIAIGRGQSLKIMVEEKG